MTKFTFDWFVEQSRQAQKSVNQWPSVMKENIVVATATLPRLGEAKQETQEIREGQTKSEPKIAGK
jgi:hypothetical protein